MADSISEYTDTYSSFSGCDMVAIFEVPIDNKNTLCKIIGTLQTITYSIHNEKIPVRTLGDMNMKNTVFGGRIIAGSMIFTVFNRHWLRELMTDYINIKGLGDIHYLSDELPPINITISMANEYGQNARLSLYGVTFINEGQVMSINDNYTENTFEFYAKDLDYLGAVSSTKKRRKLELPKKKKDEGTSTEVDNPETKEPTIGDEEAKDERLEEEKMLQEYTEYFEERVPDISKMSKAEYMQELSKIYQSLLNSINLQMDLGNISSETWEKAKDISKQVYGQQVIKANDYYSEKNKKDDTPNEEKPDTPEETPSVPEEKPGDSPSQQPPSEEEKPDDTKDTGTSDNNTQDNIDDAQEQTMRRIEYSNYMEQNAPDMKTVPKEEYVSSLKKSYKDILDNIDNDLSNGKITEAQAEQAKGIAKQAYANNFTKAVRYYSLIQRNNK